MTYEKGIANSILVFRIFTLLSLAASVVLIVTNNFTLSDGSKIAFTDLIAYRYVLAVGAIGLAYTVFQIPFSIYYVCTEKRLIRNGCLPKFDCVADKVMSFLLATGMGVGFGVTYEIKKLLPQVFDSFAALGVTGLEEEQSKDEKFLKRGYIATALLSLGFLFMALLSFLSSVNRTNTTSKVFFFR